MIDSKIVEVRILNYDLCIEHAQHPEFFSP